MTDSAFEQIKDGLLEAIAVAEGEAEPVFQPTVSRADALTRGLTFYFNGVPCAHGHVADRYTRNGKCRDCLRMQRNYQGGAPSRGWPADMINRLRELHAMGQVYSLIAAHLGVSRSAVAGKIKRLGLASASPVLRVPRKPKAAAPPVTRGVNTYGGMATKLAHAKRKEKAAFGIPAPWMPEASILRPQPVVAPKTPTGAIPVTTIAGRYRCSILNLTNETCRWPCGGVNDPVTMFCGAPGADLAAGMPYCGSCAPRAYVPARWRP